MVEILHTHDRAQADLVRVALEAEGLRVESLNDDSAPFFGRHVLAVSETDAPRAIAIRRRLEQQGAADRTSPRPIRKLVIAAIIVFWIAVGLLLIWLRR